MEDAGATATRIAAMGPAECLRHLESQNVPFRLAGPALGVETPVRLTGPLGGVTYRTDYPDRQRSSIPYEVLDCRMVAALLEFSAVLREQGVDEARMYCAWRPPLSASAGGRPLHAHPAGLAVDLRLFKKSGGESLEVETDFNGRVGAEVCGGKADAPSPDTRPARELRAIFCGAVAAKLFHVQLSPNNDEPHHNHFHMEVRPGVRWFIVR